MLLRPFQQLESLPQDEYQRALEPGAGLGTADASTYSGQTRRAASVSLSESAYGYRVE